ncbi:hypothetical protein CEXT_630221, partial [Caerostris extrusa]
ALLSRAVKKDPNEARLGPFRASDHPRKDLPEARANFSLTETESTSSGSIHARLQKCLPRGVRRSRSKHRNGCIEKETLLMTAVDREEHISSLGYDANESKHFCPVGGLIERELVLSVSVSGVGACLREVLSGVVSGLERASPCLIRIFSVHGGSLYHGLTKKYVLPGRPHSSGEFLSQRQLPVLRTTPSHTHRCKSALRSEKKFRFSEMRSARKRPNTTP